MDKLKMQTKNKVDNNIEDIGKLFPNTVTERIKGYDKNNKPIIEKAIDFEILKQELSKIIVEGKEERYQMNWPGKKEAILQANSPINKTLRPCRKESVDFDKTENLYIEGDNLEVLKLLQETYLNKVKMIYIDPPYNTGNDSFVYNDDFAMSNEEFSKASEQYDEDGNINYDIRRNCESNGRFHTDWLNMMYPRLKLAKDLLRDDGVIFISIDDNEVHDLRKICDEVLGASNFVGCAGRISKKANNQGDYWAPNFDYLLTYTKNKDKCPSFFGGINYSAYNLTEEDGERKGEKYQLVRLYMTSLDPMRGCTNQRYYIECPDGTFIIPPGETFPNEIKDGAFIAPQSAKDKVWRWSYSSYLEKKDKIVIKKGKSSNVVGVNGESTLWNAFTKTYLNDVIDKSTATPNSFIENHINQNASHELKKLGIPFDFAKPTSLIKYLAETCRICDGDIVLDFFSGSSSTADAIMQHNVSANIKSKFIMVQLPEETDEKSEAYKAGYKNICEIGKKRIFKAGEKIKEEDPDKAKDLDTGFRVLKLDSSNMKDVFYNPTEFNQTLLDNVKENIKEGRSSEDLLFQVMLDLGELLSSDIEEFQIAGNKVFNVGQGNIVACFDKNITNEVVTEIAKMHPFYAVFRDSSLSNDAVATNFEQIFKTYSPNTIRKVL